jgi:phosphoglucomutase
LRKKLSALGGERVAGSRVDLADDFSYVDPVDGSISDSQGIRLVLGDGSRIVCRLSGTGTEGAMLRVYLERYRKRDSDSPIDEVLRPLASAANEIIGIDKYCGRSNPTLIT